MAVIESTTNSDGTTSTSIEVLTGSPNTSTFTLSATYLLNSTAVGIVTADFNGDGWLDLAIANADGSITVFWGEPNQPGQFQSAATYQTQATTILNLLVADFNQDGLPDIALIGAQTVILLNSPGSPGTFAVGSPGPPYESEAAAVADFNGDGYPDIAVGLTSAGASPNSDIEIYYGDAANPGHFQTSPGVTLPVSTGGGIVALVAADLNADGLPDIAVGTSSGAGTIGPDQSPPPPGDVVIFLASSAQPNTFLKQGVYQADGPLTDLVAADVNDDGNLDLLITEADYTLQQIGVGPGFPIWFYTPTSGWIGVLRANSDNPGSFFPDSEIQQTNGSLPTAATVGAFGSVGSTGLAYFGSTNPVGIQLVQFEATSLATLSNIVIDETAPQNIVATYSGDGNYQGTTATGLIGARSPTATSIELFASALFLTVRSPVTFTASVSGTADNAPSSGTVTFYNGSTVLASVPLTTQGTASYTTDEFVGGSYQISAAYQSAGPWMSTTSTPLTIVVTPPQQSPPSGSGLLFVPITPCRVLDTRGNGFSGAFGPASLNANTERDVSIQESGCGVPTNALVYSLNVTAIPQGPLGYLTIWGAGSPQPSVSTLNSWDGRVVANAAVVLAGAFGSIALYASNTTDAVVDINGYFTQESTPAGLAFYPVAPCRVADTRGNGFAGSFGQPGMTGGSSRSFPIQQSTCQIPVSAQAYALNITAIPSSGNPLYFLTAWPSGQSQPYVSTLNSWTGDVVANAAIVPAGSDGGVDVFVTNDTDVLIDINGYFAPPGANGALGFYPIAPCRAIDTRGNGFSGSFGPPSLVAGANRSFPLTTSACRVPADTQAYSLNVTVVPPAPLWFLALWPTGESQPFVSTLDSWRGEVLANAALVPAAAGGSMSAFASDTTDLLIDVNGVFAP